jgi:hypothetical protein
LFKIKFYYNWHISLLIADSTH